MSDHSTATVSETSVSTSLDHLVTSSQAILTKRIDLALLEGQQLLSRSFVGAVVTGIAVLLAAAAWMSGSAALSFLLLPSAEPISRLAVFGLLNSAGALGCLVLVLRQSRPLRRKVATAMGPAALRDAQAVAGVA